MNTDLQKVALRNNAILIHSEKLNSQKINNNDFVFLANCMRLGFNFSEELISFISNLSDKEKNNIIELFKEVTGVDRNWTPLVKQWDIPTNETIIDHIITFFINTFEITSGTLLPCGHFIPDNTFPIEKYNGCPFCGTQFNIEKLEYEPNANNLKVLDLWNISNLEKYFISLLASPISLNASQIDSLKRLLKHFVLPKEINIEIKETLIIVIDELVNQNKIEQAGKLFKMPNDILRYLWYKNTGFLQLVEPKTIKQKASYNAFYYNDTYLQQKKEQKKIDEIKLKFTRKKCKIYAGWLTNLDVDIEKQCENMHPKREIWIRVIRALRLAEYSKKQGFSNLKQLLDVFYNKKYDVFQGQVNYYKQNRNADKTFELLKQRPSIFARSLFATILWFGSDKTLEHFNEVIHEIPKKFIYTLNMYAENYFNKENNRLIKTLGGTTKIISPNRLLENYTNDELLKLQKNIENLSLLLIKESFEKENNNNKTIFIDKALFNIPLAIGDRNENLQDFPEILQGTRFKVKGDNIRLFMQWGQGLPAQHLDMDLSCNVSYEDKNEFCNYEQLVINGCKHSGDIQKIPEMVGTAEYIDVDIKKLSKLEAKYVTFTCNAYTIGELSPNMIVGWMNSKYKMRINSNGVAYNPTEVQHQIKINSKITKGLVFGVLDIKKQEIIWLEMDFGGQRIHNLEKNSPEIFLKKLDAKIKIGNLLKIKAEIQKLKTVEEKELADEVYDVKWALNIANVNDLLYK